MYMGFSLELLSYIAVVLALYGSYLNSKMSIYGFYYWFISNWWFIGFNLYHEHYVSALLNAAYQVITVYGIMQWSNARSEGSG
jgi:hypothetical protein